MKKATIILPTTGKLELSHSLDSALNQSYENTDCYLVVDGPEYADSVKRILDHMKQPLPNNLKIIWLPENVGSNGFYGHRIYASFPHLINSEYILFLDEDNWFQENHVKYCVETMEKYNHNWCYSLRLIHDNVGNYLCRDDCESLGEYVPYTNYFHIDTNCYCLRTKFANNVCHLIHGGWGADRIFAKELLFGGNDHYGCTGKYSVSYRLKEFGNPTPEFFYNGNAVVEQKYHNGGQYPWQRT